VAKALNRTPELKISDIVIMRSVGRPDELHGKGKKWQVTRIIRRIRKGAKGSGKSVTLTITAFIEINILSIPKGTGFCR